MTSLLRACALSLLLPALACAADASDWSVRVTPFDQVFPALELSQARRSDGVQKDAERAFGAGSGLIAVRIGARRAFEHVHLRVEAAELEAATEVDADLPLAGVD